MLQKQRLNILKNVSMCEITFIMNAPSRKNEKLNNLQVFGGKKTKEPK